MAPLVAAVVQILLDKFMEKNKNKKKNIQDTLSGQSTQSTGQTPPMMKNSGSGIPTGQILTPSERMQSSYY